jgi:hypothetical protein
MSYASALYRQPRLLDRQADAGKRVRPLQDYRIAGHMNGMMLTAVEFLDACKEYVIAFVAVAQPGGDGQAPPQGAAAAVSPVALLGLRDGENLMVRPQDGQWDARYVPAFVRRYPFAYAADGEGRFNLLVDAAWEGFNDHEGELLVQPDGEPTAFLKQVMQYLDRFEQESLRTRAFCERLVALDLLVSRQLDGTLPEAAGGQTVSVTGFSVVDEEKLRALPDAVVLELHRNGMLGLIQAHLLSLGNAPRLLERLAPRIGPAAAGAPSP